ncbi:CpsD/CapB family tyrosine-protein kinase [Candidatus Omnitrophota bacterium]
MQIGKISKALQKAQKERQKRKGIRVDKIPKSSVNSFNADLGTFDKLTPKTSIDTTKVSKALHAFHDQHSYITEEYRIMRTNINTLHKKSDLQTLLISSSIASEGKTVTSLNYAYTLACDKTKRVVVIDCDLRKGTLSRYFAYAPDEFRGVTDVLMGFASLADVVVSSGRPNCDIIFRGNAIDHPVEALDSKPMHQMLQELRKHYDYIILDAPPILPVTDACVLASQVDGMLLVIKMGKTPKATVQQSLDMLKKIDVNLIGTVLTNVEYVTPGYGKYYYTYGEKK